MRGWEKLEIVYVEFLTQNKKKKTFTLQHQHLRQLKMCFFLFSLKFISNLFYIFQWDIKFQTENIY